MPLAPLHRTHQSVHRCWTDFVRLKRTIFDRRVVACSGRFSVKRSPDDRSKTVYDDNVYPSGANLSERCLNVQRSRHRPVGETAYYSFADLRTRACKTRPFGFYLRRTKFGWLAAGAASIRTIRFVRRHGRPSSTQHIWRVRAARRRRPSERSWAAAGRPNLFVR